MTLFFAVISMVARSDGIINTRGKDHHMEEKSSS